MNVLPVNNELGPIVYLVLHEMIRLLKGGNCLPELIAGLGMGGNLALEEGVPLKEVGCRSQVFSVILTAHLDFYIIHPLLDLL